MPRRPMLLCCALLGLSVLGTGCDMNPFWSPLTITPTTLPNGQLGVEYCEQIVAILGLRPYEWALTSGSLPGELALQSVTGVVWGTPTQAGTFTFTAQDTDGDDPASTDSVELVITVVP